MQIHNRNKKKERYEENLTPEERRERDYPNGAWHTGKSRTEGIDAPLGVAPPDKSRYSMTKRNKMEQRGKLTKPSRMKGAIDEAAPHTIWIRKDIWAATEVFKIRENRSNRSIVEEALYRFLIQESRVEEADDMGEAPENSSWVK